MKKFLKKIGLILAAVAVAFGFGFMPMTAYAEEVTETPEIGTENTENSGDTATDGEIPETNENGENTDVETGNNTIVDEPSEDKDKQTVISSAICGVVGLTGTAVLCLIFSGKFTSVKKIFESIVSFFTEKKEELATEEVELKKIKEDLSTFKSDLMSAISSNDQIKTLLEQSYENNKAEYEMLRSVIKETVNTAVDMVKEMKGCYENRALVLEKQFVQIKTILVKIATGSSELVRQGLADDIVKMLEKDVAAEAKGEEYVG